MTGLRWNDYDFEPHRKVAALQTLLQAGLKNHAPASVLCGLAGDITRLTPDYTGNAVEAFEAILGRNPDCVDAWSGLAQALRIAGDKQRATVCAEEGLKIASNRSDLLIVEGKLQLEDGRYQDAVRLLKRAAVINQTAACVPLCETLIRLKKPREAEAVLMQSVEQCGWTTSTAAVACVLNQISDKTDRLDSLLNFGLVQESDQRDLFGADELDRVNQRIADCLDNHPALIFEPESTATYQGSQTTLHKLLPEDLAHFVIDMIQNQVDRYVQTLPDHPFQERRPDPCSLTVWIVVLNQAGHQHPHIHPAGWLSGVYYVCTPEDMRGSTGEGSNGDGGAIEIGRPPEHLTGPSPSRSRIIHPFAGQMLLFPSYFYHRTIPQQSSRPRICIAFDVG